MKLIGKKIGDIDNKYHTINGQKLRGRFVDTGYNNGQVIFLKGEKILYKAGVIHTSDHDPKLIEKQNETITSLWYELENANGTPLEEA